MHILLAAATPFEIQPTLDFLLNPRTDRPAAPHPAHPSPAAPDLAHPSPNTSTFAHPSHHTPSPHRISTLITGIGSLPTAWSLMRQIDRDRPDLIIQAGIAGSFTHKPHGHVLAVRDETLADLGVWEDRQSRTLFDLGLANPDQPPFTAGRLVNPYQSLLGLTGLELVSSVTVNEISTLPDRIAWYRENFSAVVESMEGGALHFVALKEQIAFVQIRSISNDVGIRDKSKWNIPLAIQRLNDRLIWLLQELNATDDSILNALKHSS